MDEPIGKFCKSLATFCNHLQTTSDALKQSVDRRPVPLDSASTTFLQCLNRRVTSASTDLNLLESMSFGTVSFEELLGHCNEVFKKNQNDLLALQHLLQATTSYIPSDDDEEEHLYNHTSNSCLASSPRIRDDYPLLDDSLSLKSLGLSEACLATIASEANSNIEVGDSYQPAVNRLEMVGGNTQEDLMTCKEKSILKVSKDNYENLPKYMKGLASWEDLLVAVEKVNLYLKEKGSQVDSFQQDEISSLQLGPKARSYLMLLIKLNGLVVQTTDGSIYYKILSEQ